MRVVHAAILAGIAGALATPVAAVAGLGGSRGPSMNAFDVVVYVVDWANIALFGQDFPLTSVRTAGINAAAWSLVGALVGASARRYAALRS